MSRQRLHDFLEAKRREPVLSRVIDGTVVVLALAGVSVALLETDADFARQYWARLSLIELLCGVVLTVEYVVRVWVWVWVCVDDRRGCGAAARPVRHQRVGPRRAASLGEADQRSGRLNYCRRPTGDALAGAPGLLCWMILASPGL